MTDAPISEQNRFCNQVAEMQKAEELPSAVVARKSGPVARHPRSIPIPDDIYSIRLETLDLSLRVFNLIKRAGISLLGQLLEMEESDLKQARLGERSIEEVVRAVQARGLLDEATCKQEEGPVEIPQVPQERTSTTSIGDQAHFLKRGWQTWSITFLAPLGQNPEIWQHAGLDRGQWSLPYRHGEFPHEPGTIVTYDGQRSKLASAREARDLCRSELAEKIGCSREQIRAWEQGTMDPSPDATSKLCRFFGKERDELDLQRKFYVLLSIGTSTLTVREVSNEDLSLSTKEELQGRSPVYGPGERGSGGRRDKRERPGRGKRRHAVSQARVAEEAHFCYKVPFAPLPDTLRAVLPRRVCHQGFSPFCYIQPFMLNSENELIEWQGKKSGLPDHCRIAWTPEELREADIIHVTPAQGVVSPLESPDGQTFKPADTTEQRLHTLTEALINPFTPSQQIRVAPSYFLGSSLLSGKSLQDLIAPGVSFPDAYHLPESGIKRRHSLSSGAQVAIPEAIACAPIERGGISEKTESQLRAAEIATLGDLLIQEEESLRAILDDACLSEVYTALCAKAALPIYTHPFEPIGLDTDEKASAKEQRADPLTRTRPVSGTVSAEWLEQTDLGEPAYPTVYIQLTGVTYDDEDLGRLSLVHVSPFVDCFDGGSGPMHTLWLTEAQIKQSKLWDREFERLDALEARIRVTDYASTRGATPPEVRRKADRYKQEQTRACQDDLVPLKDPERSNRETERPLELFVSLSDAVAAKRQGKSNTAMLLSAISSYIRDPDRQPIGLEHEKPVLKDIHRWIGKDRKQRQGLISVEGPFPHQPNLIMHTECRYRQRTVQNCATGEMEMQMLPEVIGCRVIIGVRATTGVPDQLIVQPRTEKPPIPVPDRPIRQIYFPNYVPIPEAMVA
jgi:DNA-binding XRE family transcriptional regulator